MAPTERDWDARREEVRQIVKETPEWAPAWVVHIEQGLMSIAKDRTELKARIEKALEAYDVYIRTDDNDDLEAIHTALIGKAVDDE